MKHFSGAAAACSAGSPPLQGTGPTRRLSPPDPFLRQTASRASEDQPWTDSARSRCGRAAETTRHSLEEVAFSTLAAEMDGKV